MILQDLSAIVTPKREIPRKMIAERLKVDILESKPFFG